MIERRPPTHLLQLNVPLNLEANPAAESYDIQGAMAEALQIILPISRLGTLGLLCDEPEVTFHQLPPIAESPAPGGKENTGSGAEST